MRAAEQRKESKSFPVNRPRVRNSSRVILDQSPVSPTSAPYTFMVDQPFLRPFLSPTDGKWWKQSETVATYYRHSGSSAT
ncbi:hypothetical protein VTO73DRAFT_13362 [Trametes versicolor]